MRDFKTIKRKSDSIDRSWTSSMMICFSKSGQGCIGGGVLRKAHSDLVKSRSLSPMAGPALQHSKCNTVGDKSESGVPRRIAIQPD